VNNELEETRKVKDLCLNITLFEPCIIITTTTTTTTIIIIIITAVSFSLGGSSPYTSTDKTIKNKYT
jgi:hypothetical protein